MQRLNHYEDVADIKGINFISESQVFAFPFECGAERRYNT
jgi:hypothetical protein